MLDIARLANVSTPTVSRVLNGSALVNEETRERVLRTAWAHGYAVNRNAQKLRHARANTVAVMLDFGSHRHGAIGDPFIFELLAGVSEALSVRNQDLLLSPPGLEDARAFRDLYRAQGADGFIVLGQGTRDEMLRALAKYDVPLVVWGAVPEDAGYCAIGSDNLAGGRLAGEHFLAHHRQHWLFVGDIRHEEFRLRYEGLRLASLGSPDITLDLLPIASMAFTVTAETVARYLGTAAHPDAVFAFSDTAAMAVAGVFRDRGLTAPRDYSLVGYNNIPPAAHFSPAITTIDQKTDVAGALLVEKLMQQIEGDRPESVMLPTRMVKRET
ncbi:LacI family DNA-binding transcriptional regulator [Sphingomonas sp. JC676]|uniref:LacI family DNA-binding transcriptional regulator n=1 Tax=Sphingomonas sp. JC676 TaxID=2768065 RepID=UPI00223BFD6B|nr:substrate-binding domain-containing protein [Sphingomonas sp. JC676]